MATKRFITRNGRVIDRDEGFRETLAPSAPLMYREPLITSQADSVRPITFLQNFIGWIATLITGLLAVRFLFSLLDVNAGNALTYFVYDTTNPLVAPFANLISYQPNVGTGYFDVPAIIAGLAVILVAGALMSLLRVARSR